MNEQHPDDPLLEKARRLQEKVDQYTLREQTKRQSGLIYRLQNSRFYQSTKKAIRTILKFLGPVGAIIFWLVNIFEKLLAYAAFRRKDGQYILNKHGSRIFSIKRFFSVIGIYALVLFVLHVTFSALYFYSTQFQETVYVTGKQEIETGELYQFGGCTSLPCSTVTDNGKFYLIESSLYYPRLLYPEENVFANIPQQDAACRVQGYGVYFRSMRWIYKSLQLYQHVYDVSCRPYTQDEISRSVSDGTIVSDEHNK